MFDLLGIGMAYLIYRETGKGGATDDAYGSTGVGVDCSELAEPDYDEFNEHGVLKIEKLHRSDSEIGRK